MTLHKISITFFTILSVAVTAQSSKKQMSKLIQDEFQFAEKQYKYLMKGIQNDKMPQSYKASDGKMITKDISWWCSGFYPGSLWMIYEQTKDPEIKKEAERTLNLIESNKTFTRDHDLGFIMFCSFGNAYRIQKIRYIKILFSLRQSHFLQDFDRECRQFCLGIKWQISKVLLSLII